MNIHLLTNQNNTIGSKITYDLQSGHYSNLKIIVAYAKNSAISKIYEDLSTFINKGGKLEAIIGIDQKITSYQALINLSKFTKDKLFVHHDKGAITFHPKMYLFGNQAIENVYIGSSNLTSGGLYTNFEANVNILLDSSNNAQQFQQEVTNYWQQLLKDKNTKQANKDFIHTLFTNGALSDENNNKEFKKIIQSLNKLPFESRKRTVKLPENSIHATVPSPLLTAHFAMSLSNFDVSSKSQDPVLLIPITALKANPNFWNWPNSFTLSGANFPQYYTSSTIKVNKQVFKNQIVRFYFYEKKREFRLQCEAIKRNGASQDIILIKKNNTNTAEYDIQLVRKTAATYPKLLAKLKTRASKQKMYGYF